jgi:N-acetylmuramoyl-L-alanine amidase
MWWHRLRQFERDAYDYPGTSYFVESHKIRRVSSARPVQFIVIHITGGMHLSPVVNHFIGSRNNTSGASAHYIVDRDGTIVQMVRDTNIAGHCGNLPGVHNRNSIGIEHVCSTSAEITPIQYEQSANLVRWLCSSYSIPVRHNLAPLTPGIRGHIEELVTSGHRGCPNSVWDWEYFINKVRGRSD